MEDRAASIVGQGTLVHDAVHCDRSGCVSKNSYLQTSEGTNQVRCGIHETQLPACIAIFSVSIGILRRGAVDMECSAIKHLSYAVPLTQYPDWQRGVKISYLPPFTAVSSNP